MRKIGFNIQPDAEDEKDKPKKEELDELVVEYLDVFSNTFRPCDDESEAVFKLTTEDIQKGISAFCSVSVSLKKLSLELRKRGYTFVLQHDGFGIHTQWLFKEKMVKI